MRKVVRLEKLEFLAAVHNGLDRVRKANPSRRILSYDKIGEGCDAGHRKGKPAEIYAHQLDLTV